MKHHSLLLTTLGILFFFAATAKAEPTVARCQTPGLYPIFDVDGNGKVDAFTDGAALMAWTKGRPVMPFLSPPYNRLNPYEYINELAKKWVFDIDGDNVFTQFDAEIIFAYLAGVSERRLEDHRGPKGRRDGYTMAWILSSYTKSKMYCYGFQ